MYSNKLTDDMYVPMLSDEEIDVLNSGDEDDMMRGGPYRHPAEVYMVNDDDGMYDDDQLQYEYVDDEYHHDPNDTEGYIDAHYINTDPEFLAQKDQDEIYLVHQSSQNVEHTSTAERLAKYPEMRSCQPLRRPRKQVPLRSRPAVEEVPKTRKVLDPKASAINALLTANRIYPSTEEVKNKNDTGPLQPPEIYLKQPRLAVGIPVRCDSTALNPCGASSSKMFQMKQADMFEPRTQEISVQKMTPLPDRFFQKRYTITAEHAGFKSDCLACKYCGSLFRQKALLDSHEKKHKDTGKLDVYNSNRGMICPVQQCNIRCDCIATVIYHMRKAHSVKDIMFERVTFKDMTEFKLWRSELERLTFSKFSRTSGKQNVFSKSTYYQCHHSGNIPTRAHPSEVQRKRTTKKLGKTCTAFLHVKENDDGTVLLRGCTRHTGHGQDVRFLPVTDDIKMEIAQMLIQGLDEMEILEKMAKDSDPSNRRYHLQTYEVRNVYSKIEKFKEDYKKRLVSGDSLPDLAEVVSGKSDRPLYPAVSARAKLAVGRYPVVVDQYEQEQYYPDQQASSYGEVVEDDGLFHVPKVPEREEEEKEEEKAMPTRVSERLGKRQK
uniref:C2H2-type domain-containing protein n=1 Tax=Caenorhabditis tropicalis TaxID=1561998 RepID=A0A1I7T1P3_9PELO